MCSLAFFPRILQKDARRVGSHKFGKRTVQKVNLRQSKTSKYGQANSKEVFEPRPEDVKKRFCLDDVFMCKIDKTAVENSVPSVNFLERSKNFLLSIFKQVTSNILKLYNIPRPRNLNQFVVAIREVVSDSSILCGGKTNHFLIEYDHLYSKLHRSYCSMRSHSQDGNANDVHDTVLAIAQPTNNLNRREYPENKENVENAAKKRKFDEMAEAIQSYGYIIPVNREKMLKQFELQPKVKTLLSKNDKMTTAMINFVKETDRIKQTSYCHQWQCKHTWTLAKPVEKVCSKPTCLPPLGPPPILSPPPPRTPPLPICKKPRPNKPKSK